MQINTILLTFLNGFNCTVETSLQLYELCDVRRRRCCTPSQSITYNFDIIEYIVLLCFLSTIICIYLNIWWYNYTLFFMRGIHRSPVNSSRNCQWHGALVFSLICAWANDQTSSRNAGDLRRNRRHYDVTVMVTGMCLLPQRTLLNVIFVNIFPYIFHTLPKVEIKQSR